MALIEQTHSADVTVLPAEDDEHGMTMVDPQRGSTIVAVATSESPMRWRSTLAHELGHLVYSDHDAGSPNTLHAADSLVEDRAMSFARHLLLPPEALQRRHTPGDEPTLEWLAEIVQQFQVSPSLAARQMHEQHLIDDETHQQWRMIFTPELAARFGWIDQYRALQAESRQRRSPQRLLTRAIEGYVAGVVPAETLAGLRGVSIEEMQHDLEEAGIRANPVQDPAPAEPDEAPGEFIDLSWLDDPDDPDDEPTETPHA